MGIAILKRTILIEKILLKIVKYKYKVNDGEIIGEHNGAHFFTIGQGLNLGGYELICYRY